VSTAFSTSSEFAGSCLAANVIVLV